MPLKFIATLLTFKTVAIGRLEDARTRRSDTGSVSFEQVLVTLGLIAVTVVAGAAILRAVTSRSAEIR